MKDFCEFFLILFAICVSFIFGGILAGSATQVRMEKTAIENKVAEWQIDSQTGEKSFVWLSPIKGK